MIKKIISGGQTGAEQAALDAAIQFQIAYGGWIPKGRLTESGKLAIKYKLSEMPGTSFTKKAEQNVLEADGTILISFGKLSGELKYIRDKSEKNNKPNLCIDLEKIDVFKAAHVVKKWAADNSVETLNISGSRFSENKYIYQAVKRLLTTAFHMQLIESSMPDAPDPSPLLPQTIAQTVEELIDELPLRDKSRIANMKEYDLILLDQTLGSYIRNKYLWNGSRPIVMKDNPERKDVNWEEAAQTIIYNLWKQLKETHRLHVVKK